MSAVPEGQPSKTVYASSVQASAPRYENELSPLPCWSDLEPAGYGKRVADFVTKITEDAAAERREKGTAASSVAEILAKDPMARMPSDENQTRKVTAASFRRDASCPSS